MERLLEFVKNKKKILLLAIISLICFLYIFFSVILKITQFSIIALLFIIGIGLIVYILVSIYMEYLSSKRKLTWVNSIYDDFVHMQIFLDNNNIVIEVLEGEAEKLEQLANIREFKTERLMTKNDLVKILVK